MKNTAYPPQTLRSKTYETEYLKAWQVIESERQAYYKNVEIYLSYDLVTIEEGQFLIGRMIELSNSILDSAEQALWNRYMI